MIVIDYRQLLDKIDNPPYTLYSAGDRAAWLDECITTAHAFDAEPVKHGHWEYPYPDRDINRCSVCGFYIQDKINNVHEMYLACPRCFARMDGDGE